MTDIIITVISIAFSYYYAAFVHEYGHPGVLSSILVFAAAFLICYAILCVVFWILCFIISIPINTRKEYKKTSRFYTTVFGLMLEYAAYLSGVRVRVRGLEKIPGKERFLFVSNHRSSYDTIVQCGEMKLQPMAFISKPENFKIPLGHRYMTRCRYLSIDRADIRSGARVTRQAAEMISSGQSCIGVYPEGTRNCSDRLLDFKNGCFKIALWAKCPIVVSVISGTDKIHKNFPFRRTKVIMEIIDVIPYSKIAGMKTQEISELVRGMMEEHLITGGKQYESFALQPKGQ